MPISPSALTTTEDFSGTETTTSVVTKSFSAGGIAYAIITWDLSFSSTITVTDSASGTWTLVGGVTDTVDGQRFEHWRRENVGAGSLTITVTFSHTNAFKGITVTEISGAAAAPAIDGSSTNSQVAPGTGTDVVTSGNANSTNQPILLIGGSGNFSAVVGTPAAGTGFTSLGVVFDSQVRVEHVRLTSTGNHALTWTSTVAAAMPVSVAVAFDEAATTTPQVLPPPLPSVVPPPPALPIFRATGPFAPALPVPALAWLPRTLPVPAVVAVAPSGPTAREVHPFSPALPVVPLSWAPRGAAAPFLPVPPAAIAAAVGPVTVPGLTPLSWAPVMVALALALPRAPSESRLVEPLSPAFPVPALSWAPRATPRPPEVPAPPPPSRQVHPFAPALPVPPLSWKPPNQAPPVVLPVPAAVSRRTEPFSFGTIFPLRVATERGGRHLVDVNGRPFQIRGRASWNVLQETAAKIGFYLADTKNLRFTAIESRAASSDGTTSGSPPPRATRAPFANNLSLLPFTNVLGGGAWNGDMPPTAFASYPSNNAIPDVTTPDTAPDGYWEFVDAFLNQAQANGLAVLFFPMYCGFAGTHQGWMEEMVANGTSRMTTYGAFIANRYKNQKNLIWMIGGDTGTGSDPFSTAQRDVEQALVDGMASVTGQQSVLMSAEWNSPAIFGDQTAITVPAPYVTISGAYDFLGDIATTGRRAFADSPARAPFGLEYPYDEEGSDGTNVNAAATQPVRRFTFRAWLATIGGYMTGNGFVWPFDHTGIGDDWENHLASTGALDLGRLNALLEDLVDWWKLLPSGLGGMRSLVPSGGGAGPSASDYISAACAEDGRQAFAYVPPASGGTFTFDLRSMCDHVRARWWNPSTGTFTTNVSADGTNTLRNTASAQSFTTPGANGSGFTDWLLFLDSVDAPELSWLPRYQAPVLSPIPGQGTRTVAPLLPIVPPLPDLSWLPRGAGFVPPPPLAAPPRQVSPFAPALPVPALAWAPAGTRPVLEPVAAPVVRLVAPFAPSLPVPPLSWQTRGAAPLVSPATALEARAFGPLVTVPELAWLPRLATPLFGPGFLPALGAVGPLAPLAAPVPPLAWLPALAPTLPLPPFVPGTGAVAPFAPAFPVPALSWAPRLTPLPVPPAAPAPPSRQVHPFAPALPVPALAWQPRGVAPVLLPDWPGVMRAAAPLVTPAPVVVPPLAWLPVLAPTPALPVPGPVQNLIAPLAPALPVPPLAWAPRLAASSPPPSPAAVARRFEPIAPAALPAVQWLPILAPPLADPGAAAALARAIAPVLVPGAVPALAWAPSGSGALLVPVALPPVARAVGPFAPALPVSVASWLPAALAPSPQAPIGAPPISARTEPFAPVFPVPPLAWAPSLVVPPPPALVPGAFAALVAPLLPPPPPPLPDLSWFPSLIWAPVLPLQPGLAQAIAPLILPTIPPPLGILHRVALHLVAQAQTPGQLTADTIRVAEDVVLAEPYRGELRVRADVFHPVTVIEGFPIGLLVVEGQGGQELLVHLSGDEGEDQVFPVSGALVVMPPSGGPTVTRVAFSGVGDVEYLVVRAVG